MQIGISVFFAGTTPPELIGTLGRLAEERGIHSIWVPEHVLFFRDYDSKYPYAEDGQIPGVTPLGVLDPFSALTYLAAHTERIRLGTGICIVPQRNPFYTARQVADLDYLSGGRFDFGVGLGWLREEFAALKVPWERRAQRTREYLELMKRLWSDKVTPFQGEFYDLPECEHGPKPVQKPHPPIIFGGEGDPALRRVAEIGQGWYGYNLLPEQAAPRLKRLDELLSEAGRSRADVSIQVCPQAHPIDASHIAAYEELGVDQVIVWTGGRDADQIARRLDELLQRLGHTT